jgi:hypothetical protein
MKEDIIRMARDSGMELYGLGKDREKFVYYLQEFATLVAAAEREACAKVAEAYEPRCDTCPSGVANAIRARGQA